MLPQLRMTLRRGTVYYMLHPDVLSDQPHYLVVLNREPVSDRVLVLACCSSSLDRNRQMCNRYPGTYVEITPEEYPAFRTLTSVNGGGVVELPMRDLENAVRNQTVRNHDDMPADVVDRIAAAVRLSPRVANELKAML